MTEKETFRDFIEGVVKLDPKYKNLPREEALYRIIEGYADWVGKLLKGGVKYRIELWDEKDGWGSIIRAESIKKDMEEIIDLLPENTEEEKFTKNYFKSMYCGKEWSLKAEY